MFFCVTDMMLTFVSLAEFLLVSTDSVLLD